MAGGVLSKIPEPPEEMMPGRRELVLAAIRIGAVGLISMWFLKWVVKYADPSYQQRQKAKVKAKEIMGKLGVKDLNLNEHEVMIATHLIDPNNLRITWSDVAGLDEVIEQIKKTVIYPVLAHRKMVRLSRLIEPPKGVLLYGPPGCGKTLIAKAMAKEARCWFINLDVSVLTDKWYGESQKLTAAVFSLAEKLQPCIIFIDEIDSLLRLRNSQDHEVTAMMKAQFMSLWDGLITDPKKTVIVMGATNRPKDMDAAILRRMAAKFHIPIPDLSQRKYILDLTLKNEILADDFSLEKLAMITDGFSGADLKEVARSAAVACLADLTIERDMEMTPRTALAPGPDAKPATIPQAWSPFQYFQTYFNSPSTITEAGDGECSSSAGATMGHRAMSLRPISMKDFEVAINKTKESRAHCGNAIARQRFELD